MDQNFALSLSIFLYTLSPIYIKIVWMISQSSKTRMLIAGNLSWYMIFLQAKSVEKRDPALDQSPEDNLEFALKINNPQLQNLQLLLLARDSLLLECLGHKRPLASTRHQDLL
jgi:hypothetical protein